MDRKFIKLPSSSGRISLKAVEGHFATTHAHVNYYLDMTEIKTNQMAADECAQLLAHQYSSTKVIHTIMCLDETQVIGGFLAQRLSKNGIRGVNHGECIHIVTPEMNNMGQMIFRDNIRPLINHRSVLLLLSSIGTGKTVEQGINCIQYYGGHCCAVSSIFSAVDQVGSMEIHSLFHVNDIPDYESYSPIDCPYCRKGKGIEALINGFGYFKV